MWYWISTNVWYSNMYILIPYHLGNKLKYGNGMCQYINTITLNDRKYTQFVVLDQYFRNYLAYDQDILASYSLFYDDNCYTTEETTNKKTRKLSKLKIDKEIKLHKRTPKNQEKEESHFDYLSSSSLAWLLY